MVNKSEVAVSVHGLTIRRRGRVVLDGLDAEVASGAITGLLGPSGSGKSTLLRAVVGVQRTRGGSVTVLGEPAGSATLRRRVGYATQSAAVYDDLTVRDNIRFFAAIAGLGRGEAEHVLDVVGLASHAGSLVADLSGGQRGRVSLGVALLGEPELIVLDEPTVGLDPVLREELWATFRRIADAGATLIVSSHVMDEAARCDRLLLLRGGALIADTTPAGLLADTGEADPERAFLTLIRRDEGRAGEASRGVRPRTRRERRAS